MNGGNMEMAAINPAMNQWPAQMMQGGMQFPQAPQQMPITPMMNGERMQMMPMQVDQQQYEEMISQGGMMMPAENPMQMNKQRRRGNC